MGGDVWDFIAPVAGAALGSVVPGVGTAIGAAIGSGLKTGVETGDPLAGLVSAGGTYAGSALGAGLGGTVGGTLNSVGAGELLGPGGAIADSFLGNTILDTSLGSIAGGSLGGDLAKDLFAGNVKQNQPSSTSPGPTALEPFKPKREAAVSLPGSFSQFGNLSPEQQATNIATQGVFGGGTSPQEENYYLNTVNRRLVGEGGQVGDMGGFKPIEKSYLGQLGYSGFDDPTSLLEALSKRRMA